MIVIAVSVGFLVAGLARNNKKKLQDKDEIELRLRRAIMGETIKRNYKPICWVSL